MGSSGSPCYSGVPQRLRCWQHPKPRETGVKRMLRSEGLAELCVRRSCGSNLLPAAGRCVMSSSTQGRPEACPLQRAEQAASVLGDTSTARADPCSSPALGAKGPSSYPHSELSGSSLVPILTRSQDGGSPLQPFSPTESQLESLGKIQKK